MVVVEQLIYGICALSLWSLLYRENPIYRVAEYFYVGFAAANAFVLAWEAMIRIAWTPVTKGQYIWILPIILSIPFLLFFYDKTRSTYMIPISVIVSLGTALGIRGAIHAQLIGQIYGTMGSLIKATGLDTLNVILIAIGSICSIIYFIFTKEIKGSAAVIPRIGRIFIMATFGAAYANTGMGRLTNMSGIILNLWKTDAIYIIPVALAVIAIDIVRQRMQRGSE